jgi:hypothetical protein
MTVYAFEAQETWLPTVVGLSCTMVEVEDTLLRLHFGPTQTVEDGLILAERTIVMYGVWRVEHGESIIVASGDLDSYDPASKLTIIHGATLERFDVSQPGFDLDLYFSGNITARCFPCDSSQYDEDMDDDDDYLISWWVDGRGVSDNWEDAHDPHGI